MRLAITAAAFTLSAVLGAFAQGTRINLGQRAFLQCYSCHSVRPGETEGLQDPNLFRDRWSPHRSPTRTRIFFGRTRERMCGVSGER